MIRATTGISDEGAPGRAPLFGPRRDPVCGGAAPPSLRDGGPEPKARGRRAKPGGGSAAGPGLLRGLPKKHPCGVLFFQRVFSRLPGNSSSSRALQPSSISR